MSLTIAQKRGQRAVALDILSCLSPFPKELKPIAEELHLSNREVLKYLRLLDTEGYGICVGTDSTIPAALRADVTLAWVKWDRWELAQRACEWHLSRGEWGQSCLPDEPEAQPA